MSTKKRGIKSSLGNTAKDTAFSKLSIKEKGQAIHSNPDSQDEIYINIWIELFERSYPRMIASMRRDVEKELTYSDTNKHAELNQASQLRKGFWLPEQLQQLMETAYPSFFTNKKHAEWFCRKFPVFSFEDAANRVKT